LIEAGAVVIRPPHKNVDANYQSFSIAFSSPDMSQPALHFVHCPDAQGGHRMAWWQWGDPQAADVMVCVHGLSRQGRDFDTLAQALCERASGNLRVICPDMPGRGESDWLKDPMGYQVPNYAADMLVLLKKAQADAPVRTLAWVGTSMGGLIGMVVCGQPGLDLPVPVRRLVLNDVGPSIEWRAIQRIGQYLGKAGHFDDEQQAADALLAISPGFGPHSADDWLRLSRPMLRPVSGDPGSRLRLHYDPAIAIPFRLADEESARQGEAVLWGLYDRITAQTLLVRGRDSDLLSMETARAMAERGPRAQLVEFEGVGHAPTLVAPGQVACVADFLLA
jgi:pimeloyl-ACP methyl ester carboxylesterase